MYSAVQAVEVRFRPASEGTWGPVASKGLALRAFGAGPERTTSDQQLRARKAPLPPLPFPTRPELQSSFPTFRSVSAGFSTLLQPTMPGCVRLQRTPWFRAWRCPAGPRQQHPTVPSAANARASGDSRQADGVRL